MESPFSFHCMICFEWFEMEKRYPVVLPCGHTYICNACAVRLDKCMECRTPLYTIVNPGNPNSPSSAQSNLERRYRSTNASQAKPNTPIKKRLPLPKNLVLMSLIEATELAAENVRSHQKQGPSLTESPKISLATTSIFDTEDDDERDEAAKIRAGTSLAISDCGTYAVAANDGLEIFPSRPASATSRAEDEDSEGDVDTLVRFFHLEHSKQDSEKREASSVIANEATQGKLSLGDRVQIVSMENGWAKLARGYGFVKADKLQLVKVGGSVDRACKLESLLRLLSTRRRDLRTEQMKVDNDFITLMNELQVSLMADEDLTVIAAHAFQDSIESFGKASKTDTGDNSGHPLGTEVRSNSITEHESPLKPRPAARSVTPPARDDSRSYFCAAPGVFDSIPSPRVLDTVIPFYNSQLPVLPAPTEPVRTTEPPHQALNPTKSSSQPSVNDLREGARAWREMNNRPESGFVGINFRTGMSGHSALLSASAHAHGKGKGRTYFSMSNHTGLSMSKARHRHIQSSASDDGSTTPNSHYS